MPEIKPDQKEEKKKGGLFADLFGRGGSGFGGATGGAGLAGGLLATKAGLIALILVATTLAGGLGLIGYKFFGPGDSDRLGAKLSLFNTRPPAPAGSDASADASKSGNSDSLSQLASANQPAAAPADQIKADAAPAADAAAGAAASAAAAGTNGAQKSASASAAMDAAKARKGSLSFKSSGIAAAGAAGGGGAAAGGGPLHPGGAKMGASTGLGAGGARARAGGMRGMAGKMGAANQLMSALSSQKGATSSQAAGKTYDGGSVSGGDAGQAVGGAGDGAHTAPSNSGSGNNTPSLGPTPEGTAPPPAPGATNVTPWQNAINMATMCLVGAAVLIMLASKLKAMPAVGMGGAMAVCAIAAMLAGFAAMIGHQIASGPFGQVFQGNMFVAAGTFMAASAVGMAAMQTMTGTPPALLSFAVIASGALGIGMALVGKMSSPTSYPPNVFSTQPGGVPPDMHLGQNQYKVRKQGPVGPSSGEVPNEFIV
jgi:hypothetical protein